VALIIENVIITCGHPFGEQWKNTGVKDMNLEAIKPRGYDPAIGWLRLVGLKIQVSFAKEIYKRDLYLQRDLYFYASYSSCHPISNLVAGKLDSRVIGAIWFFFKSN